MSKICKASIWIFYWNKEMIKKMIEHHKTAVEKIKQMLMRINRRKHKYFCPDCQLEYGPKDSCPECGEPAKENW